MKKYLVLLTLLVLALTACGKEETVWEEYTEAELYQYPFENVNSFCIAGDGDVFVLQKGTDRLERFDAEGKLVSEYLLGEGDFSTLCSGGDKLYFTDRASFQLLEFSPEQETMRVICTDPQLFITTLVYKDGHLYCISLGGDDEEQARLSGQNNYNYMGERFLRISPEDGSQTEYELPEVLTVADGGEKTLFLYGYNGEKGYYFAEFDTKREKLGKKRFYDNFRTSLSGFLYLEEQESFLFYDNSECVLAQADQPEIQKRFCRRMIMQTSGNDIARNGDEVYLLNSRLLSDRKLYRFSLKDYQKETPTLKVLASKFAEIPEGLGYTVEKEYIAVEDLSLKLLAGDSDYDIVILHTDMPAAAHMLRQGAYEPLPEEGFGEAFGKFFSCAQEAAKVEGGYWMLPFQLSVEALIYNKENCEAAGIDVPALRSIQELEDCSKQLYDAGKSGLYELGSRALRDTKLRRFLNLYAFSGDAFDSEGYRELATGLKASFGSVPEWMQSSYAFTWDMYAEPETKGAPDEDPFEIQRTEHYRKLYYMLEPTRWGIENLFNYDNFSAAKVPPLVEGEEEPSLVTAEIMVINPNSKRKSTALSYLRELAKRLPEQPGAMVVDCTGQCGGVGKQLQEDMYRVIADGKIIFDLPEEIASNPLYEYLLGNTSAEEAAAETERQLRAYLFE